MQSYPEHQQDDPDFGQFVGQRSVGNETGGEGTNHDPGDKITDERREFEAMRDRPHDEGNNETGDNRADQGRVMGHSRLSILHGGHAHDRRGQPGDLSLGDGQHG